MKILDDVTVVFCPSRRLDFIHPVLTAPACDDVVSIQRHATFRYRTSRAGVGAIF
jgi:hypothetical protein